MAETFSVLDLACRWMAETARPGDFCIDATAGRGRDTAYLCELVGQDGRVLALDLQPEAVSSTLRLLERRGLADRARVILDSHANLRRYAPPDSARCIAFNFGWLPGGDHKIFTRAETSVEAVQQGLDILQPGGVMTLCIYYGRENGCQERDALLQFLRGADPGRFTVVVHTFANRGGDPPIFILVRKDDANGSA